jgi:hypothetical protein
MAKGSNNYRRLKSRLGQLRKHLLYFLPDPPVSQISYSDREIDSTRAYVVLVHAEIESFCEELVRGKAQAAKLAFDTSGEVKPILRRMVAYYVARKGRSWGDVLSPPAKVVRSTFESYKTSIEENHGVRRKNLEKLLFPLGIHDKHLNKLMTWLAQMDSFGKDRGGLAHRSIGAQQAPDPLSQLVTVNQLLNGLLELDRIVGRIR